MGYCLGGLLAYLTATRTDADATVSYYGVGIDNYPGEAAKTKTPALLHVAEEDGFVSKDSQATMKAGLTAPNFQLHWYPGRDHAGDARKANERTMKWFDGRRYAPAHPEGSGKTGLSERPHGEQRAKLATVEPRGLGLTGLAASSTV